MFKKNIKDFMSKEKYNKWKTSCVGKKSSRSKKFIIINPKTNEIVAEYQGVNEFAKMMGYTYPSSIKKFLKSEKPLNTKHITKYQGCIFKYID